jgi:hypothetical protein
VRHLLVNDEQQVKVACKQEGNGAHTKHLPAEPFSVQCVPPPTKPSLNLKLDEIDWRNCLFTPFGDSNR